MACCLIDVRCLQDPLYAERGVGRHASALLHHARTMLPDTRLVGITDPALPPLAAAARASVDEVRTTAYTGALTQACCHVQMSPMTHDPLFVARLLQHPSIPAAAAVYDFIPLDEPGRYLPTPEARLGYDVALHWLARHQAFLPISTASATRLKGLLRVDPARITVTGAPLDPTFEALRTTPVQAGTGCHVLVVGGGDSRKNAECAVLAHAACPALQAACIPLVVTGTYDAAWLRTQRAAAVALGGTADLVQAPGHVTAEALLHLYGQAICVVVPSRAEGFSLPVIEAMAAGIPVLASDIPAHRELMGARLFDPADPAALSTLLAHVTNRAWHTAAMADQEATWPRFRAAAVAERFWGAVRTLQPRQAPAVVRNRARVALLTPLPPSRSGVADYSAACCAELGRRTDLHVFTPTPDPVQPLGSASVAPLSILPMLSTRFDRIIGVLGNSAHHLGIMDLVLRHGAAVILHDSRLADLYAWEMPARRREAVASAELGRPVGGEEIRQWVAGFRPPPALMLGEVAAAAQPLLMHAPASVQEARRRYGIEAVHLPFSLYRTLPEAELTPRARDRARARLELRPNEVLVATFGGVHQTKAPVESVWALEMLRGWGIPARLRFVGVSMMDLVPLRALIDSLGLRNYVDLHDGHVDEVGYRDVLVAADLGLQLRTTGAGSLSGGLADCIAAGVPSVASACLVGSMDVPAYVTAVPDVTSPVLVAEALANLLGRPPTSDARRAYTATHSFDTYAARLCAALDLPGAA